MRIGIDATRAYAEHPLSVAQVARRIIDACKNIQDASVQWVVACLPDQYDAVREGWRDADIHIVAQPVLPRILGLWAVPLALHKQGIDVFLSLDSVPSPLYFLWRVRVVHCIHDLCYRIHPDVYPRFARYVMYIFDGLSARLGARICCPSCEVADDVRRILNPSFAPHVVRWAYHGCGFFADGRNHAHAKESILLWIGRIEKKKNPALLLDIIEYLHAKGYTHYRAVMVGNPGFGFEGVVARMADLEARGILTWHKSVSSQALSTFYARSSALIVTSVCEGYAMTVDEALSWGVPVIGPARIPSIRYHATNQLVHEVEGDTIQAYAHAIDTLLRARTSDAPQVLSGTGRSWDDVVRDIIHVCGI